MTIVRLYFEQIPDDSTIWTSACRQSVAMIVNASHQSSSDMDTMAHGIALVRFATRCEAKAQVMWMCQESESVLNMDPLKHLHMGQWPCLKGIICCGQDDIALPVCWLWGDCASNLLLATMTQCSLGASMIQSLVTICPHLCNLSLAD